MTMARKLCTVMKLGSPAVEGLPVHAGLMSGRMGQFVEGGRVVGLRAGELAALRQDDLVGLRAVVGAVARDVPDRGPGRFDDGFGGLMRLPSRDRRLPWGKVQITGLFDVEHGVDALQRESLFGAFIDRPALPIDQVASGFVLLRNEFLGPEEDNVFASFALADVASGFLDLAVRRPAVVGEPALRTAKGETESVASGVGIAGDGVPG